MEKQVFKAGCSTIPEANYPPVFRPQNSYRRFFGLGQLRKKPPFRQVFLLCYFRGRPRFSRGVAPVNFPKQITLLFSAPKVFKADCSHTSQSELTSCFPPPKFLPPFFWFGATPKKSPFRQVFLLCYFQGSPHTSRSKLLPCFPPPKFLPPFFWFVATQKKPPFRQVFLLCYFRGRPRFSSGVAPPELPEANYSPVFRPQGFQGRSPPHFPKRITLLFSAPKILTAIFLIWDNPEKNHLSVKFSSYVTFGGRPAPKSSKF